MTYRITKTFGPEMGWSCAFRQWKARGTHCRFFHGYALGVKFIIEGDQLDNRNWLFSFGEFKEVKEWLAEKLDHKTLVAEDDPALPELRKLAEKEAMQLTVLPSVGCEHLAQHIFNKWENEIHTKSGHRAHLVEVEVREHNGNAASFIKTTK